MWIGLGSGIPVFGDSWLEWAWQRGGASLLWVMSDCLGHRCVGEVGVGDWAAVREGLWVLLAF